MIFIDTNYLLVAVKAVVKVTLSMARFAAEQSAAVSVVCAFNEFRSLRYRDDRRIGVKFINDSTRNVKAD